MKVIRSQEVPALLHSGSTVAVGGFGAYCCPDELLAALETAHAQAGTPDNFTFVTGIGTGNNTDADIGLNRLRGEGLIGTMIAAHLANCPVIGRMVGDNRFPAFVLPLGVVARLMAATASGEPGVLTHVGKGTFADPQEEACCANQKARESGRKIVEAANIGGKQELFYPAFPVDAALIRATYADEDGNLSFAHEALTGLEMEMAMAAHNSGGLVIAQVEKIVARGSLDPKAVRIHRSVVDYVVVADPVNHRQSYATDAYRAELSGEVRVPAHAIETLPLDVRKVIARRGAMELQPGMVINLGIGIPSGVGSVANEEGIRDITMSLESGPIGGVPVAGVGFAAAVNPESIASLGDTFYLYDGGGLDMTCLGAAEIDEQGNVNVSSFNGRCTGPGGFINISQSTPKVCFMFAFTAGKTEIHPSEGRLHILQDGKGVKFVPRVQQITFSADYARQTGQQVLYITERCVFRLDEKGLLLTEVAPGVDIQRDILDKMCFRPRVSPELKTMDAKIFCTQPMGLCKEANGQHL